MLDGCDVGHRVVIRRRLSGGDHGPVATDLLGTVISRGADRIVIRTEAGVDHDIDLSDVLAGKPVPPRPARYSEIVALELLADQAWPAPVHERLGTWRLRAAAGFTGRANSALPIAEAGQPLPEAIKTCQAWYAGRGLTARINVMLPVRRDVADAADALGWTREHDVLVQTAGVDALRAAVASPPAHQPMLTSLSALPSPELFAAALARKKHPDASEQDNTEVGASAWHVLTHVDQVRFAEVRATDGSLLAFGRGALCAERTWLHLALIEVDASARRRGLARHVVATLVGWAADRGASRVLLQVDQRNDAARALYNRLGFLTHHRYVTFREPAKGVSDGC